MNHKTATRTLLTMFAVILFAFTGCSSPQIHSIFIDKPKENNLPSEYELKLVGGVPVHHVLMFNKNGKAVDPTGDISCSDQYKDSKGKALCDGKHALTWPFDYDEFSRKQYDVYIEKLLKNLKRHPKDSVTKKRKVVFFVHGGLNSRKGSLDRIIENVADVRGNEGEPRLKKILDAGYYPIFINWHSSLFSTYTDHLFHIRRGENWSRKHPLKKYPALLASPVYLINDIVRIVFRAPLVWFSMALNDYPSIPFLSPLLDDKEPESVAREISCRNDYLKDHDLNKLVECLKRTDEIKTPESRKPSKCKPGFVGLYSKGDRIKYSRPPSSDLPKEMEIPITVGTNCIGPSEVIGLIASNVLATGPKLITGPIIDGVGSKAWDNMLRRVKLLYYAEDEFNAKSYLFIDKKENVRVGLSRVEPSGGLSIFMRKLAERIKGHSEEWDITLVGHSMGTIVLNEMVRSFGVLHSEEFLKDSTSVRKKPFVMPFNRIIYMASAATIRDYEENILPYLRRNTNAKFYNLMLHRHAERRETGILNLTPQGSLLVWIDDMFSNPLDRRDKTLGRFDNFMLSYHDVNNPEILKKQIHPISFSTGGNAIKNDPQTHGGDEGFGSRFKLWEEGCLQELEKNFADCFIKIVD